jgi:DNA-binding HxlR family transcriptional regulator
VRFNNKKLREYLTEANVILSGALPKRSYAQYCALARALDLVGERWTLLVLRELLLGPKRYTDLLDGLPGIGTALLASRLRDLETEGVVRRRKLRPPAGSTVYELTEWGCELEPALIGLARWGGARLGAPGTGEAFRARWLMLAMQTRFDPEAARDVHETYEFRLGEDWFHVRVDDGSVSVHDGVSGGASLIIRGEPRTFLEAVMDPEAAGRSVAEGALEIEGDPEALARCRAIFAPALPSARGAASR